MPAPHVQAAISVAQPKMGEGGKPLGRSPEGIFNSSNPQAPHDQRSLGHELTHVRPTRMLGSTGWHHPNAAQRTPILGGIQKGQLTIDATNLQHEVKLEAFVEGFGSKTFRVQTAGQKHVLEYYRQDRDNTSTQSPANINTNTIALVSAQQFKESFDDYAKEVAKRLAAEGTDFDPSAQQNVIQCKHSISFHSDSGSMKLVIHAFPVAGNVVVFTNSEWQKFRKICGLFHRTGGAQVLAARKITKWMANPNPDPELVKAAAAITKTLEDLSRKVDTVL